MTAPVQTGAQPQATVPGATRIHAAFARAAQEGRAAFIPFMTAGYPLRPPSRLWRTPC